MKRVLTWWNAIDPSWRAVLPIWATARVGFSVWAAVILGLDLPPDVPGYFYHSVPPLFGGWQGVLLGVWQRWDSVYYQVITEQFYANDHVTVFFPAYPVLARVLMQISGLPSLAALLVVSSLAALFSLVLLHSITRQLFPDRPDVATRTVIGLVLFPSTFFLFGIYPQSLVLMWMLLAYDQARRGHWLVAGLAGLLGGLTHATVVALAVALGILALQTLLRSSAGGKWRVTLRGLAILAVPVLPLLGMALFLAWREAMGFPSFSSLQESNWERVFSTPWQTLWALVVYLWFNIGNNWVSGFNAITLVLAMVGTVWGLRRLPLALSAYQVVMLLYFLSNRAISDPLLSVNRFVLVIFPMYMVFGTIKLGRRGQQAVFGVCLLASLGVSAMFFMWKWVG
jgi:hypothetical protein